VHALLLADFRILAMCWTSPFTAHPREQGLTYWEHWWFAIAVAARLARSVVAFAAHAILPCVPISARLDLEATAERLLEYNRWIEAAKRSRSAQRIPASARPRPRLTTAAGRCNEAS